MILPTRNFLQRIDRVTTRNKSCRKKDCATRHFIRHRVEGRSSGVRGVGSVAKVLSVQVFQVWHLLLRFLLGSCCQPVSYCESVRVFCERTFEISHRFHFCVVGPRYTAFEHATAGVRSGAHSVTPHGERLVVRAGARQRQRMNTIHFIPPL